MAIAYFKEIVREIIKRINAAEHSIQVAVCWFNHPNIFEALLKKVKNGNVSVELIVNNDANNNNPEDGRPLNFKSFIAAGGKFYFSPVGKLMHNKYCIIDDNLIVSGSANWTKGSEYNFENVVIHENDESLISQFRTNFNEIRNTSQIVSDIKEFDLLEEKKRVFLIDEKVGVKRLGCSLGVKLEGGRFKRVITKGEAIPIAGEPLSFEDNDLHTVGDYTWADFDIYSNLYEDHSTAQLFRTFAMNTSTFLKDNTKMELRLTVSNGHTLSLLLITQGKSYYGKDTFSIESLLV